MYNKLDKERWDELIKWLEEDGKKAQGYAAKAWEKQKAEFESRIRRVLGDEAYNKMINDYVNGTKQ